MNEVIQQNYSQKQVEIPFPTRKMTTGGCGFCALDSIRDTLTTL